MAQKPVLRVEMGACVRALVPQGRASIGGASVELLRVVVVVVVVPLLLLVVEFSSCVASCPGSVDDEVPAAVKQEAGPLPAGCDFLLDTGQGSSHGPTSKSFRKRRASSDIRSYGQKRSQMWTATP